jgi:Pyruvate kinase, barrel domain
MYDRASKESFTTRFYKQGVSQPGPAGYESHGQYDSDEDDFDERFKQVEWFQHKNTQEPPTQGGVIEIDAPLLPRSAGMKAEGGGGSALLTGAIKPASRVGSSGNLLGNNSASNDGNANNKSSSGLRRSSNRSRKLSTTHHLHHAADIMDSLE